jgi:hypothetical protein
MLPMDDVDIEDINSFWHFNRLTPLKLIAGASRRTECTRSISY